MRFGAAAFAGCLLAGLVVVPRSSGAQAFTQAERAVLESGEPVRHPRSIRRGGRRHIGGASWRVIPRPIDEVWRAVDDRSSLCRMLPECVGQRVVAHFDNGHVMRFTHAYGPVRATYHLRITFDPNAHDVHFRLDPTRPNDVSAVWGFVELHRYRRDDTRTLVSWGVMADPGSEIMTSLLGSAMQDSLLRVPDEMFDYLVGPARNRYREP